MEKKEFTQRRDTHALRTSCDFEDLQEREWRDLVKLPGRLFTSPKVPKKAEAAKRFRQLLENAKKGSPTQSFSTLDIAKAIQQLVKEELVAPDVVRGQLQNINIANSADRKKAYETMEEEVAKVGSD
jgi:hypothetical protein